MRINTASSVLLVVLLSSAVGLGQLPSSRCDVSNSALQDCTLLTQFEPVQAQTLTFQRSPLDRSVDAAERSEAAADAAPASRGAAMVTVPLKKEGFHWRRA